jgi:hypothetical protein
LSNWRSEVAWRRGRDHGRAKARIVCLTVTRWYWDEGKARPAQYLVEPMVCRLLVAPREIRRMNRESPCWRTGGRSGA